MDKDVLASLEALMAAQAKSSTDTSKTAAAQPVPAPVKKAEPTAVKADSAAADSSWRDASAGAGSTTADSGWRGASAGAGSTTADSGWRGASAGAGSTTADSGWRGASTSAGSTTADSGWRGASTSAGSTTADSGWRGAAAGTGAQTRAAMLDTYASTTQGQADIEVMRQTRANPALTLAQFKSAASQLQVLRSRDGKTYRVKSTLSKNGGEGAVLLCSDQQGRDVAAKLYYTPLEGNGHSLEARLRVLAYMRTQEGIDYTLEVTDIGIADIEGGRYYFEISPFCTQKGLIDRPHTVDELKPMIRRMNEALHNIHQHGILHRDLKEENLFLQNGQIVIGDFGVAKLSGGGATATTTGTMGYTAPEALMAISAKDIAFFFDERCDYYSLGVTIAGLYEGHFVWQGFDAKAMTLMIKQSSIPLKREDPHREQLENLLTGLCQFDANLRFGYEEVLKWLDNPDYTVQVNSEETWPRAFDFMGKKYRDERSLFEAISATPENWEEGSQLLYAGYLASFFKQIGNTLGMAAERYVEQWRNRNRDKGLAAFLKELYRPGPLVWRGYTFRSLEELAGRMKESRKPQSYGEMLQLQLVSDWLHKTSGLSTSKANMELVTAMETLSMQYPEEACYWFGFSFSKDKSYPVFSDAPAADYASLIGIMFDRGNVSRFYKEIYPTIMERTGGAKLYGYLRYLGCGDMVDRIWKDADKCSEFDRFTTLLDSMDMIAVKLQVNPTVLRSFFVGFGPMSIPLYVCGLAGKGNYAAFNSEGRRILETLQQANHIQSDYASHKSISEIYRNAQPLMEAMENMEAVLVDNPFCISAGAYEPKGILCQNLAATFGYRFLGRKAPLIMQSVIKA